MRHRPMRPNIYLPVMRFGVHFEDWKYIGGATLAVYLITFFLRLSIGVVPLWFVTALGTAALSYAFFRFTKVGRRPRWFQHSIRALLDGPIARRTLPGDRTRRPLKAWRLKSR